MSNLSLYSLVSDIKDSLHLSRKSKNLFALLAYPHTKKVLNPPLIHIILPLLHYENMEDVVVNIESLNFEELERSYIPLSIDHIEIFLARISTLRTIGDITEEEIRVLLLEALDNTKRNTDGYVL